MLADLYQSVQAEFSSYYSALNSSDEVSFKALLEPSAGKLDLSVDFYGLGMFPPGAYHSEGHQDGMGVCLYPLMKQQLGDEFRFAVLDDVVMSVDRNHREFSRLLRERFPDIQFVITTHDEVWARQMQSSGLITKSGQARFHGWTVDQGPVYEAGRDYWDGIAADLGRDDVPAAAARLRRNLEFLMTDSAGGLRARVPYRPDGAYDLGELVAAVKGQHGALLGLAAKAANSWNNDDAREKVEQLKAARRLAVGDQEGEQWAINSMVHFNKWADLSPADFAPVVAAWREVIAFFECTNPACEALIHVSGPLHNEEALRCECGAYSINLISK